MGKKNANVNFYLPLVGRSIRRSGVSREDGSGGGQSVDHSVPHPLASLATSPQGGGEKHFVAHTGGISQ